ncbi:putative small lipoprotein YifL [Actinoplanes lutulentus]|uniref:Uncharacterized protein n=1 Tax=Actinoplanes lutulentus TaxID=1287878 RepID=A0A327Z581_9ACTN|nr:hypothetical protein [Actinoplanes lutulentus]MBB2947534.1 putative small lipoprotein YifL [Actinoplanes lutulentus]RAK25690.1 hypothetical protein B0I29_13141 [Actinoplanes lutulentus]
MRILLTLVIVAALAGCGETAGEGRSVEASETPSMTSTTTTSKKTTIETSEDWEITVYYTAVERFHDGDPTAVTGCTVLDCVNGTDDLGTYPADFVQAVEDEGTGQTTSGQYLNWSYDIGYWLDSTPRTSDGGALTPFVSSAADPSVLPQGTAFTITGCGAQDDGSAPDADVCATLQDAAWRISDEFTPGLGGAKHIDAYIGPETGPDFTDSAWYITLTGATITTG